MNIILINKINNELEVQAPGVIVPVVPVAPIKGYHGIELWTGRVPDFMGAGAPMPFIKVTLP